ncbi:DUF6571 family protein [Streptomyces violens]|uniref:DUF6571 family protein n=1 Tax=Streptomyces violens TaxID=66377 RepID=UPI0004C09C9B|nr:DUF6571 family protein [Streptomyces violens]
MDLEALRHGNFSLLGDAINDWTDMIGHLKDLEERAKDDLKKKSDKANWAGLNASVTREFITKTAGEFSDAVTQATTIRDILRDTRSELIKHRDALNAAIDRGWDKHLSVVGTQGGGFKIYVNVHPEPKDAEKDMTALRDELQGILNKATESDSTAAQALRAIADQAKYGFSDASYKDRDSASEAIKAAEDLARIGAKDPKDLTAKDFDKLNSGLKKYADDPLFAATFAGKLKAKGTLELWAGINDPHTNYELGHSRVDKYDDLQKNLSLTLASATQSDSPAMTSWKRDMVQLGPEPVGRSGGPMGFQVMSNLMRWGDFDDKFLNDYGNKLIATEKKLTDNGRHEPLPWQHKAIDPFLNRTGTDSGSDPMTGFMKALSKSPDAATEFFHDPFVTKDEDHDFERDTDGDEKKGKVGLSNFQYLFEERDWPQDENSEGKDSVTGRDSLALALEAATTGHPVGTQPSPEDYAHSKEQADLYKGIVESVSENPERLTKHGFMSDSFGRMSGEYMPDINRSLCADELGVAKLYPVSGSVAQMEQSDTTRFLHTLGQNPDGFKYVTAGQHAYTNALLEYHYENPGAYISDRKFPEMGNLKEAVHAIARQAGEVQGTIASGRAFEVEQSGAERDEEFNNALESTKTWVGSAAGIGVGLVAAPYTGPGAAVAGGLAGTATDQILGSIVDGLKRDGSTEILYRNGKDWDDVQKSTSLLIQQGAEKAGQRSGNESQNIVATSGGQVEIGYGAAADNVRNYVQGQHGPPAAGK